MYAGPFLPCLSGVHWKDFENCRDYRRGKLYHARTERPLSLKDPLAQSSSLCKARRKAFQVLLPTSRLVLDPVMENRLRVCVLKIEHTRDPQQRKQR